MTKDNSKKPKAKTGRATHQKKVFDVVPPGKSLAPPNSRSVIMGHKPQVKDDQFVPGQESRLAGSPSEKRPLLDPHKKIDLKPETGSGSVPKVDGDAASTSGVVKDGVAPTVASDAGVGDSGPHSNLAASDLLADLAIEQVVDSASFESPSGNAATENQAGSSGGTDTGHSSNPGVQETAGNTQDGTHGSSSDAADVTPDTAPGTAGDSSRPQTVDDLLAETDAPTLSPQKAIVSTHHHRGGFLRVVLVFLLILVVGVVALNFLLDAGVIETELNLPYTDLL